MVTTSGRNDTAIRVSRWLDKEVERLLKDKAARLEFPTKRNFVDNAVFELLRKKGVLLDTKHKRRIHG